MKKLLIAILLFSSLAGYSQARVLSGFEPSTGRPGYKYLDTLRNIYVLSPLTQPNDSTIGIDTSRFSFTVAKNATRDSIIFSFFDGVRVAIKDSVGGGGSGGSSQFRDTTNGVYLPSYLGNLGLGTLNPLALLHLGAGTTTVAPLRFTSGIHLTSIVDGSMEYNGTHLYISIGGVRRQLDQQSYFISIFDTVGSATNKGLLYTNSTNKLSQDASNLNWDDFYKRLGIGTTAGLTLDIRNPTGPNALIGINSSGTATNDGLCGTFYGNNLGDYRWGVTTAGGNDTYFGIADDFAIYDNVNAKIHTLFRRNKGIVIPKMTKSARDAISGPVQGEMVFVTDNGGYLSWYNSGWFKVNSTAD